MEMKDLTFTKFEAARKQLNTAIELWFADADPISAHSLAYASHEIIYRIFRNSGQSELSYDIKGITEDQRKAMALSLKEAPNFFKHASQETAPNSSVTFNQVDTMFFLTLSITGLMRLAHKLTSTEHALMFWALFHFPEWFPEDVVEARSSVKALDTIQAIPKQEFLKMFLRLVEKNPTLRTWFGGQ